MKKITAICMMIVASFVFSGCSLTGGIFGTSSTGKGPLASATFLKSADGGNLWEAKMNVDGKKTISSANVLAIAINYQDPKVIYLGTESGGILVTKDGAETWSQIQFPDKVYGIVLDPANPDIVYASGVNSGRAKIYKRDGNEGQWVEIYTEPGDGTVITALSIDKNNGKILYAGTSAGVIIKSIDSGTTWSNIKKAENAVISIAMDASNSQHVLFAVSNGGVIESASGGGDFKEQLNSFVPGNASTISNVHSLISDPLQGGVFFAGTANGIYKKNQNATSWTPLNIIESSKKFPIRAIAINPKNSSHIVYASSKAIYKSIDGGNSWKTFQLDSSKDISIIKFDPENPSNMYAGLRNF